MELDYILEIHFKSGLTFPMPPADLDKALYAAGSVITTECVKSISIRRLTDGIDLVDEHELAEQEVNQP